MKREQHLERNTKIKAYLTILLFISFQTVMGQSENRPSGLGLQVVDTAFCQLEQQLESAFDTGHMKPIISLLDEYIESLNEQKNFLISQTEFYRYNLYLDNLVVHRPEPILLSQDYYQGSIDYRIEFFSDLRKQIIDGEDIDRGAKQIVLRKALFFKGGVLFPQLWVISPELGFSEVFVEELERFAVDLHHHLNQESFLPIVDGLNGFRSEEYDFVFRFSDDDLKRIQASGFPHHDEDFEARFPEEIRMWDLLMKEWESGKWIILL